MVLKALKAIFGTKNDREIKKYFKRVEQINALEKKYEILDDEALKAEFAKFKEEHLNNQKSLDELLNDVFAIVREVGKRTLNMRHFDVQLIGGMVLHEGKIAEKTLKIYSQSFYKELFFENTTLFQLQK